VVRYTPDGQLDPAFNGDGRVTVDIAGDNDEALAVAVDAQGRITMAGYTLIDEDRNMVLVRLLPDGSLMISLASTEWCFWRLAMTMTSLPHWL